jgi:predicted Zn-dependent protease
LSTHPVHSTRIADLRRQVNAMGGSGGRPALKKRFMSSTRPLK